MLTLEPLFPRHKFVASTFLAFSLIAVLASTSQPASTLKTTNINWPSCKVADRTHCRPKTYQVNEVLSKLEGTRVNVVGTIKITDNSLEKATQPAEGAKLILISTDCACDSCKDPDACKCCPGRMETTTDAKGRFSLKLLPGLYRVYTEYGRYTKRGPLISVENPTEKLNVALKISGVAAS
jgi:hypothetical protein